MRNKVRLVSFVLASTAVLGCFSDTNSTTISGGGLAWVQFVDATNQGLQFLDAYDNSIDQSIGYGSSSACFAVNATTPGLLITPSSIGGITEIPLNGALVSGDTFFVTVMPWTASTVQYNVFYQQFTPAAGDAGLRVINAATSLTEGPNLDAYVTTPGAVLGTPVITNLLFPLDNGPKGGYVNVPAGTFDVSVTYTGQTAIQADAGDVTFTAGQLTTVIVTDPAPNGLSLRAFVANTSCSGISGQRVRHE